MQDVLWSLLRAFFSLLVFYFSFEMCWVKIVYNIFLYLSQLDVFLAEAGHSPSIASFVKLPKICLMQHKQNVCLGFSFKKQQQLSFDDLFLCDPHLLHCFSASAASFPHPLPGLLQLVNFSVPSFSISCLNIVFLQCSCYLPFLTLATHACVGPGERKGPLLHLHVLHSPPPLWAPFAGGCGHTNTALCFAVCPCQLKWDVLEPAAFSRTSLRWGHASLVSHVSLSPGINADGSKWEAELGILLLIF